MIVDGGGATCVGELGRGLNPPVSIRVAIWCVTDLSGQMECCNGDIGSTHWLDEQ